MRPYADTSDTGVDHTGGFGGSTPASAAIFNTQRASIHSHVINQSGKIDFITSLITRTNLQLLCVVDGLAFNEERLY